MSKYPLHEKLKAHERESLTLSGFLDMLDEQGLTLAKWHTHDDECYDGDDRTCGLSTERLYDFGIPSKAELIGLYLDIDPKALIDDTRVSPSRDETGLNLLRQLVSGQNALRDFDVFPCNVTEHDLNCECFWEQCEAWAKADAEKASEK
jgi:hypothetical protein